jgi:hypothetical protein
VRTDGTARRPRIDPGPSRADPATIPGWRDPSAPSSRAYTGAHVSTCAVARAVPTNIYGEPIDDDEKVARGTSLPCRRAGGVPRAPFCRHQGCSK